MEHKYIVALEVGSSKIRAALGEVDDAGTLTVKAVEEERLVDSVRHGVVLNVSEVAEGARKVLRRLENREGGRTIHSAYVAIGGRSTMSSPCEVERRLPVETVISRDHISQIFAEARDKVLNERDVMEAVPAEFRIDGRPTTNPVGSIGREVSALFNLVSSRRQLKRNLSHALEKSLGLKVKGYVVRQLAEGGMVLTPEEKRLGCMLVDFGAETLTVSIYKDGYLVYLATLPLGSRAITRDIASLNILEEEAERLKVSGGDAMPDATSRPIGNIDFGPINEMVSARAGEIIENIRNQIRINEMNASELPCGIIMVGRGARLHGFTRRLEEVTGMKTRVGQPRSSIRFSSSNIQPGDVTDVIAILDAVSSRAENCMELPDLQPVQTSIESIPVVDNGIPTVDTPEPKPEEPEEDDDSILTSDDSDPKPPHHGPRLFGLLKEKLTKMMSDDDDYEFESDDDKN